MDIYFSGVALPNYVRWDLPFGMALPAARADEVVLFSHQRSTGNEIIDTVELFKRLANALAGFFDISPSALLRKPCT